MKAVLEACGPRREFYFDNNNKKCFIRPRRQDRTENGSPLTPAKTSTLQCSAMSRTIVWSSEQFDGKSKYDQVKAMFQPEGVALCFYSRDAWLLYFRTIADYRHFCSKHVDQNSKLSRDGVFVPLSRISNIIEMRPYLTVLRSFYKK